MSEIVRVAEGFTVEDLARVVKELDSRGPVRPPRSFIFSELKKIMNISTVVANKVVDSLIESGDIVPAKVPIVRRDGVTSVYCGYQFVG